VEGTERREVGRRGDRRPLPVHDVEGALLNVKRDRHSRRDDKILWPIQSQHPGGHRAAATNGQTILSE
jgi:hypothetical protein